MNDFRDRLLTGKPASDPLLRSKKPPRAVASRAAEEESFADVAIAREALRLANHRDSDRHRLIDEAVEIVHDGRRQSVTLINLSGGGAMIEGAEGLRLWDRIELCLGEWSKVEAAVRWIRGNRFGLEFAHETRIETSQEELADMLRTVIQRSFPHLGGEQEQPVAAASEQSADPVACGTEGADEPSDLAERELRHPLIWSGVVHYDHDTVPVRLRNISEGGAMVECEQAFRPGAELLLDLGEAGTIFSVVHWAKGDAAGLRFQQAFDLRQLAAARPEVASPRWVAPDYLRESSADNSPWAKQWGRSDMGAISRRLGLKRQD